jgi:hypothetical protein
MGGGDSSSTSSQSTAYNVNDNRAVTSTDSHDNYSQDNRSDSRQWNDSSTTTINALDGGAIAASSAVSLEAIKQNATSTGALFAAADRLFAGNADLVRANLTLAGNLATTAADAYDGATAQANGNKTMLLTGLVVVGVVGVMAFGKN